MLLLAGIIPAAAQDTIFTQDVPAIYQSTNWPDTSVFNHCEASYGTNIEANLFGIIQHTDSQMKVYGVAVSLVIPPDYYWVEQTLIEETNKVVDTARSSLNNEYLRVWQKDGDNMQQVGPELAFEVSQGADYYWDLQLPSDDGGRLKPYPMFERYFEKAIVVQDTFVIGARKCNGLQPSQPYPYQYQTWPVFFASVYLWDLDSNGYATGLHYTNTREMSWVDSVISIEPDGDTIVTPAHWVILRHQVGTMMVFPIIVDPESAGIDDVNPVERNTIVSPNPATETVKVASGFGLQEIEVFDAAGARVHSQKASGLSATLNVASWPRGTYILRIRTAMGIATKKLIVQ